MSVFSKILREDPRIPDAFCEAGDSQNEILTIITE